MLKGNLTLWAALAAVVILGILSFIQWRGNLSLTHELVAAKDSTRTVEGTLNVARGAADSSRVAYERRLAVSDDRLNYKDRQISGLTMRLQQLVKAVRDTGVRDTSKKDSLDIFAGNTNIDVQFVSLPPETLKTVIYTPRTWWGCFKRLFGF
jgi:hypothetical protein